MRIKILEIELLYWVMVPGFIGFSGEKMNTMTAKTSG